VALWAGCPLVAENQGLKFMFAALARIFENRHLNSAAIVIGCKNLTHILQREPDLVGGICRITLISTTEHPNSSEREKRLTPAGAFLFCGDSFYQ
jgi:hypothetical protein